MSYWKHLIENGYLDKEEPELEDEDTDLYSMDEVDLLLRNLPDANLLPGEFIRERLDDAPLKEEDLDFFEFKFKQYLRGDISRKEYAQDYGVYFTAILMEEVKRLKEDRKP